MTTSTTTATAGSQGDIDAEASENAARDGEFPRADPERKINVVRVATVVVGTACVAVTVLVTILALRAHHQADRIEKDARFTAVAAQAATDMTTLGWQHADQDMARILAGATGEYRDEFTVRSKSLIDVITATKSNSVGTVVSAGVESRTDTIGQVLAIVQVATTDQNTPQPATRSWRLRLTVSQDGESLKVSKVEFVS